MCCEVFFLEFVSPVNIQDIINTWNFLNFRANNEYSEELEKTLKLLPKKGEIFELAVVKYIALICFPCCFRITC